jgi:putative transposase
MRRPDLKVGEYYHVYNRGVRGLPIVHDDQDRWRFLKMLYFFNDAYSPYNWKVQLSRAGISAKLERPTDWPKKEKLVEVLAYCLLDNHYHLILKEVKEGGISTFMRKLGVGLANSYNTRYEQSGSLFQGSYRARRVASDNDLKNLSVYVQVKNTFEMYAHGGIEAAFANKEHAFAEAIEYPFCSLADYAGDRNSPIITKDLLGEWFPTAKSYRDFALALVESRDLERYSSIT